MPVTNQKQFELIVQFIHIHPELAQGQFRDEELMYNLVLQLNHAGDERDLDGWRMIIRKYQERIIKRLKHNHNLMNRAGAGAQGREIQSMDPLKYQFSNVIDANRIAKAIVEEENDERLRVLYAEQQQYEEFLNVLENSVAELSAILQEFLEQILRIL